MVSLSLAFLFVDLFPKVTNNEHPTCQPDNTCPTTLMMVRSTIQSTATPPTLQILQEPPDQPPTYFNNQLTYNYSTYHPTKQLLHQPTNHRVENYRNQLLISILPHTSGAGDGAVGGCRYKVWGVATGCGVRSLMRRGNRRVEWGVDTT